LPPQKSSTQAASQPAVAPGDSMLAFVPEGTPRSVAEYIAALIPGAVLLFAFFLAAELAVLLMGQANSLVSIAFLPVICIMPILAGVVSTLVLEKLRNKPLTLQRGAMVGAAAGLSGVFVSSFMLLTIKLLLKKAPFGAAVSGIFMYFITFAVIIAVGAAFGALGGALVVKFIKEV